MKNAGMRCTAAIALAFWATSASWAVSRSGSIPGSVAIGDFELAADVLFELGDAILANAQIFFSSGRRCAC